MTRKPLSVVVLDRLRTQQAEITQALAEGRVPPGNALGRYVRDVRSLLEAYEAVADRLAGVQRIVDGEQ